MRQNGSGLDVQPFAYSETDEETGLFGQVASRLSSGHEELMIRSAIQRGQRDANQLTNMVFFARHPERQGRGLTRGERNFDQLSREWVDIRARMVRPALDQSARSMRSGGATSTQPRGPSGLASPPPTEGPYGGVTGAACRSGGGKCWCGSRARDVVDSDVPWNDASNRSPANYEAILDYFNVDNPSNCRYAPGGGATYCNIYVHDVTRALWASVPHWVRDSRQSSGWNELSANRTVDWMRANSRSIGWVQIDAQLCQWLADQFGQQQSLPFADTTVPPQIIAAGSRVSAANHTDPPLLAQPSYAAQGFATLGLPTIILWKNPRSGGHGHMAMVRPERSSLRGQVDGATGIFVPRSAQAGARNFRNDLAQWITRSGARGPAGALFYVHA